MAGYVERVELGTAAGDKPPHTAGARPSSVKKQKIVLKRLYFLFL
jgi:hypothetical protein